jgi:hypothetical protein
MPQHAIAEIWGVECLLYVCVAIYAVLSFCLGFGIARLDRWRQVERARLPWSGLVAVMTATFAAVIYGQPTMTFPVIGHGSIASAVAPVIISPMLFGYGASLSWWALRRLFERRGRRCEQ